MSPTSPPPGPSQERLAGLRQTYGHLDGADLVAAMAGAFPGRMAVVSSFGAESAVLLDLVAGVDRDLPVIFLDTRELFDETLAYGDELVRTLGLRDVRRVRPDPADLERAEGLWQSDPDTCCHLRKVLPLARAAAGFEVLVDGRKRIHGGGREVIATIEAGEDGLIKVSPLARWDTRRIAEAFAARGLPRHPLVAHGFRSIGCFPCTRPVGPGEPPRAGRWAGAAKTECGIHKVIHTP